MSAAAGKVEVPSHVAPAVVLPAAIPVLPTLATLKAPQLTDESVRAHIAAAGGAVRPEFLKEVPLNDSFPSNSQYVTSPLVFYLFRNSRQRFTSTIKLIRLMQTLNLPQPSLVKF